MIRLDVEQGSQAWLDARVGVLTASNFDRVITPKTGKPSASMTKLVYEMLAESIMGRSLSDASSAFMQRGTEMEAEARAYYEFETGMDVEQVGLLLRDDRRVGCSPDGLVGEDGGLEIKCPTAAVHLSYLLGAPGEEYRCQVQGSMWVTGRAWWHFLSYCPGFPAVLVRMERDEEFIKALAECADVCLALYDAQAKRLAELGVVPARTMTEVLANAA